jgi:hypothetical protein
MGLVGVYPGSFNPPTVAHLAIAEAAIRQASLARVDLAISRVPLGKEPGTGPDFEDRVAVVRGVAAHRRWLGVVVTDAQLIADITAGYDAVILGADKWAQVRDPGWYASVDDRDAAVARLPRLLVAARPPFPIDGADRLEVAPDQAEVSSTAVRAGRWEWMAPEAAAFDEATGAWSDPPRYAQWRLTHRGG